MAQRRVEIPLPKREGVAKTAFVSAQSLVNMYAELAPDRGPSLMTAPAWGDPFAEMAEAPVRGMLEFEEEILAVSGQKLYSIDSAGAETEIGDITGSLPVIMASNGAEAVIVTDAASYRYDGATLALISDVDFVQAASVAFVGQYFAFNKDDASGDFFLSGLYDGSSYDAADVARAESEPDRLRRVFADSGDLILMGAKTIEPWSNTGNLDFPFQRSGTTINLGILGKWAVDRVDNSFAWLASDKTVRIMRGASPVKISDPDIERTIASWDDPDQSRAFAFAIGGHEFLALRNPQGCVVWDATTGLWHRRSSFDSATWRACCALQIWNGAYVGDATEGKIYRLSESEYAEDGEVLLRQFVSQTMGPGGRPFTLNTLEVEIEPGVGILSGQGSEPEVWADFSRDGGYTYGTRLQRRIGASGVRGKRIIWRPNIQFRPHGGVIRFGCSDPVQVTITRAFADITEDRA